MGHNGLIEEDWERIHITDQIYLKEVEFEEISSLDSFRKNFKHPLRRKMKKKFNKNENYKRRKKNVS